MTQYCVWTTVMIVDSALIMKMAWLLADHVIRPSYYGNGVARSVVLLVQHQKVANAFKKSLVVLIFVHIFRLSSSTSSVNWSPYSNSVHCSEL